MKKLSIALQIVAFVAVLGLTSCVEDVVEPGADVVFSTDGDDDGSNGGGK